MNIIKVHQIKMLEITNFTISLNPDIPHNSRGTLEVFIYPNKRETICCCSGCKVSECKFTQVYTNK